ncbi:response regulator transcription factor [Acidaminobacter sp. JC074]|uniref:response regulator transcription factor n=1 Tax=Acidaminobacter sp. JC074 TaxID=2530199 RepID=UPI001F10E730|nr:response regulator transcription factor [Acidaminobacter sp. JC074]MCH4886170.1 response regulator transcription factor [Acidaminobacter sp. JC074]
MICYLVEDEENLNTLLTFSLKQEGYDVTSFLTYNEAVDHLEDDVDAWIVDINLPDGSGLDLVKEIKSIYPSKKVLITSARDSEIDKLLGLEIGSDDYITKPFLPRELTIRLNRLMKSVVKNTSNKTFGLVEIDYEKRLIYVEGKMADFTSKEFDMIAMFSKHPNQAFTREQLLYKIWGDDYFGSDRVVDDLIRRIRKKSSHLPIETVYGFGYRWCGHED